MDTREHAPHNGWFQSKRLAWVLVGVLALGALFLITGNATRLLSFWPFAIFLLLCPLMMFFMMKGMQGHDQPLPPEEGRQ